MNKKPFVKLLAVLFAVMLLVLGTVSALADAPRDTEAELLTETEETPAEESTVSVTLERLPRMLGYMGVGMLCIVIVMGALIGVTVLLNTVTAPKDRSDS